jgi:hypothetical protein
MSYQKLTRQNVFNHLEGEIERIKALNKLENPTDSDEYREPLSIEVFKEVKILLSWGGPEDGYKLTFDKDNELIYGVYYRADWGQYEEVSLNEEELQIVYDHYLYGDASIVSEK